MVWTAVAAFFAGQGQSQAGNVLQRFVTPWSNTLFTHGFTDYETATMLWNRRWINNVELHDMAAMEGIDINERITVADTRYTAMQANRILTINDRFLTTCETPQEKALGLREYFPTNDDATLLLRRGLITDQLYDFIIAQNCNGNGQWRHVYKDLVYDIPGSSDLIMMAVKEAFDPATVALYEYNKELPKEVLPWMVKQGYGQGLGFQRPVGSTWNDGQPASGQATWFDLYWYSHWDLPSVTQGYDMLHRLYATSEYGPSPSWRPGLEFDNVAMRTLLKTQDYPPYWRDRLIAMSYNPLTRVDVRRMFDLGVLDESGVYHAYRAIGYDDNNAKNLLNFTKALKANKTNKPKRIKTNDWICKHYKLGALDRDEAKTLLGKNGLTPDDVERFMTFCDIELRSQEIQASVDDVKSAYLSGQLNIADTVQYLVNIGLKQPRINQLTRIWARHATLVNKQISAGEAVKFFQSGILNEDNLVLRLQNLGYNNADIALIVTQAKVKIAGDLTKRMLADQKQRAKELAERNKEEKQRLKLIESDATKLEQRRMSGLISAANDKNILAWYKKDLITKDEVISRFRLKDWTDEDINRWIVTNLDPIDEEKTDAKSQEETKE